MLRIELRSKTPGLIVWATPVVAVLLTWGMASALFLALGVSPIDTLTSMFVTPLLSKAGLSELGLKAAPLILIATGLAAGVCGGVWNIGAEGQLTIGGIAGGSVALALPGETGLWVLPSMALAGVVGGAAWAAIPAALRTIAGVSEILVSLLLNYVAALLLSWLVLGPLKDPDGMNFPQSRMFTDAETLPIIWAGTRLHVGLPISLIIAGIGWVVLSRTLLGFKIRTVGVAPAAARYAGFSDKGVVWTTLLVSGGLAGLAGLLEVAGPIGQLIPKLSPGYGYTAIIVAFLGRLHAGGIILAALVVALTYIGGDNAQIELGLPNAAVGVVQAMLLFFLLASDFLVRYRVSRSIGRTA